MLTGHPKIPLRALRSGDLILIIILMWRGPRDPRPRGRGRTGGGHPRTGAALGALLVLATVPGCGGEAGPAEGGRTSVASVYPLAFAAQRVGGPGWEVIDLTPPGAEAHDVELTLEDRAAIASADLVVHLGDLGFQPQVEDAVGEAGGQVVAATEGLPLHEAEEHEAEEGEHESEEGALDPHAWLDPVFFGQMVERIAEGFAAIDPDGAEGYRSRAADLGAALHHLDARFRSTLDGCRFDTIVVSHEAFGYLAERYGLRQVGLAGLVPEGEPTVEALSEAAVLLREEGAGAVFYEEGGEAKRLAEQVAADAAVPALPLLTLEAAPTRGDYLTAMEANLESLREGLVCE
jgi:zinc transport system substrate-binding protein